MLRGLDEVPGKVPPFIRSVPLEKAMDGDTLVATHMNGSPLDKHHGFPARALVPGWIGAASCKWLSEIKVLEQEFDGNFMKPGYRLPNHSLAPGEPLNVDDSHVITALNVKSVIASPGDGAILHSRAVDVQGAAWAGEAEIVRVEVSSDECPLATSSTPSRPGKIRVATLDLPRRSGNGRRVDDLVARNRQPGTSAASSRRVESERVPL